MFTEINTTPKKVTDIPIYFKYNGTDVKFNPKDDLTPIESFKVIAALLSNYMCQTVDSTYYIDENKLHRHFEGL